MKNRLHSIPRLAVLGGISLLLVAGYFWVSTSLPSSHRLRAHAARGSTRILDRHGTLLYEVPDPLGGWQQPVPLSEIPLALQQATIAVEDRSFYQNPGVDLRGMVRAGWQNLRGGQIVAGGSTITQQFARSFLLDPHKAQQRTLERKVREMVLALKLTSRFSKDEILALYLNQTYYGGMAYGVEAAAQHLFGKPVRELDLAECALLAGLPQAPSAYYPLINPDAALQRQQQVLEAMVRAGFLAPHEAEAAHTEPLQFASHRHRPIRAPHAVYYVLDRLSQEIGSEAVARGGLTITTTLDVNLHETAQALLHRHIAHLSTPRDGEPDHEIENGAVVVLDPTDGAILAMVGSPDFFNAAIQGQVNATLAPRQPGSAIKPLTYAAALERGWTAATMIEDEPSSFATREGIPYTPENYNGKYYGPLPLREALAISSNVAAVKVLDAIGVPALLQMAERLGMTTLQRAGRPYGLALTLGGGEVTLLELTAAYAGFANGGMRVAPSAVLEVSGPGGERVWREPQTEPQRVLDAQVAYLISDILSDRYARMRVFGTGSVLTLDRPAAVKTGTTTDWRDNWTVGYTPDYVAGVWVGNARGEPMESVSGLDGAGPVWHDVMLAAHRGLPAAPFVPPAGLVEQEICIEHRETSAEGPSACLATRREYFVAGTEPHPLSRPARRRAAESVRTSGGNTGSQRQGKGFSDDGVSVVAPAPGARFALSPGVPRERQRIAIEARASDTLSTLSLFVDGQHLATFDQPPYRVFWQLVPGTHTVSVEGRDREGTALRHDITFKVQDSGL